MSRTLNTARRRPGLSGLGPKLVLIGTTLLATVLPGWALAANLILWHTFPADTPQEELLQQAVDEFVSANPAVQVEVTRIPYLQNLPQFINSAQGGSAPDLIRLSDTEVGKISHISVEGLPLLEDLRPHLTPQQRMAYDPTAMQAMRYGEPLYALPVSQGCLTLMFNKDLFTEAGEPFPTDDWTSDDMIAAGKRLSNDSQKGLSLPLKWSYWFLPFQWGFGASPFSPDGTPTLNSAGTAEAVEYFLDLQRVHGMVASGTSLESMATQFQLGNAAMVFDGPWAWDRYREAGIDVGLALLPVTSETGLRMSPMLSYFGWGVSKQSAYKVEAVQLAMWLSSSTVQKRYALASYMLPVNQELIEDTEINANPVLAAYLRQTEYGRTVPTSRASSMLFEQLDTALEMTETGKMTAGDALQAADDELKKRLSR